MLFLVLVGSDQLSKALVPRSWVQLDPGTGRLWPWFVSHAFRSPTEGGRLDLLAAGLLLALAIFAMRCARQPLTRAGATVLLAGMSSNLLDRMGFDYLSQGVHGRFVVNWFDVGGWRVYVGNVADLCYVVGCALLVGSAGAFAGRVIAGALGRARQPAVVLALVTEPERGGPPGRSLRDMSGRLDDLEPVKRLRSA